MCRPNLGGTSPADVAAMSDEQLYSLVINMKQPNAPPVSMPAGTFVELEQSFLADSACLGLYFAVSGDSSLHLHLHRGNSYFPSCATTNERRGCLDRFDKSLP